MSVTARVTFAGTAALAAVLLAATPAMAQTAGRDARARALFDRGVHLSDRLEWAEAAVAFEQSFALQPRPATLMNLGLAHRALGRYVDAIAELERFVAQVDTDPALAERTRAIVREMRALVATVTVRPTPPTARIAFDDRARAPGVAFETDPGRHLLVVGAAGFVRNAQNVELRRGEHRVFDVRLENSRAQSAWPWVIGVGVAVVAAVVTTAVVIGTTSERPAQCGTFGLCVPVP